MSERFYSCLAKLPQQESSERAMQPDCLLIKRRKIIYALGLKCQQTQGDVASAAALGQANRAAGMQSTAGKVERVVCACSMTLLFKPWWGGSQASSRSSHLILSPISSSLFSFPVDSRKQRWKSVPAPSWRSA